HRLHRRLPGGCSVRFSGAWLSACGPMTDGACAPTSPPPANLQRLSRLFLSRDERAALDHCAQCSEVVTFAQTVNKMGQRGWASDRCDWLFWSRCHFSRLHWPLRKTTS